LFVGSFLYKMDHQSITNEIEEMEVEEEEIEGEEVEDMEEEEDEEEMEEEEKDKEFYEAIKYLLMAIQAIVHVLHEFMILIHAYHIKRSLT